MKKALTVAAVVAVVFSASAVAAQMPESQVVFENQSLRVTVLTFVPGGATGRHQGTRTQHGRGDVPPASLEAPGDASRPQ